VLPPALAVASVLPSGLKVSETMLVPGSLTVAMRRVVAAFHRQALL
jgi:hypothetical protein